MEIQHKTDVFNFTMIRPPVNVLPDHSALKLMRDGRQPLKIPLLSIIRQGRNKSKEAQLMDQVKAFVAEKKLSTNTGGFNNYAKSAALLTLAKNGTGFGTVEEFVTLANTITGSTVKAYANTREFKTLKDDLWDSLYAFYILKRRQTVNLEEIVDGLRAVNLVEALAKAGIVNTLADLTAAITVTPVISPVCGIPVQQKQLPKNEKPEKSGKHAKYRQVWQNYYDTYAAWKAVMNLKPVVKDSGEISAVTSTGKTKKTTRSVGLVITKTQFNSLPVQVRTILSRHGITELNITLTNAIEKIEAELSAIYHLVVSIKDPLFLELKPANLTYTGSMTERGTTIPDADSDAVDLPFKAYVRPLGVGDLKVVKQSLIKYVTGEVAHIENILKGENKERNFRTLDRSEEIFSVSNESEESTEKDNQSTDRFELKKESEKTIKNDQSIQAGVTVSGSYGPVDYGAHADFANATSTLESAKTASNFARDVIDRTLTKIQKKVKEERSTKNIHEVEEINKHGFANLSTGGNIAGIYRWVDKHYLAQVYNYGKRMMFEFIIPEPAAFYLYSQNNKPDKLRDIEKPEPLGAITHKDIHSWNYNEYVSRYQVHGAASPPPLYTIISGSLGKEAMAEKTSSASINEKLMVPRGYTARYWTGKWVYQYFDHSSIEVLVGNGTDNLANEDNQVPFGVKTYSIAVFLVNVEVYCERTTRHYEEWQIKTYEAIMTAYKIMKAEYDDKIASLNSRKEMIIASHNPRMNRELESYELRKHCITVLTNQQFNQFNSMNGIPPEINIPASVEQGSFIQFFEQAFEWNQLTYLFYPYFWGRKENWITNSNLFDNDPLFSKFLQAGSARVVVPVSPKYNDAVLYYLENGLIWNGGVAPRLEDPLFISIHEELKNQQDDLANAIPEGEPWDVIIPTSLVYLQEDSKLPEFS